MSRSGHREQTRGRRLHQGITLMSGTLGTAIRASAFSRNTTSPVMSAAAPRQDSPPPLPRPRLVVLMPLEPAIA